MFTKTSIHNNFIRVYVPVTTGLSNMLKRGSVNHDSVWQDVDVFLSCRRCDRLFVKSAVGRCVIFETDTQVDPAQTASCILKCTHNKTGTYYNYRD